MGLLVRLGIGIVLSLVPAVSAQAQSLVGAEIRGGIFAHSVDGPVWDFSRIQDANVELLFDVPSFDQMISIGQVRPHVGATINFGGLESMAYAGLTWTVPVFDTPVFVEGSFGGAIHNGASTGAIAPARNLGCSVLFHELASIGVNITPTASIMATVEHASHAGLCGKTNRGLTNLGVRVGFKF